MEAKPLEEILVMVISDEEDSSFDESLQCCEKGFLQLVIRILQRKLRVVVEGRIVRSVTAEEGEDKV